MTIQIVTISVLVVTAFVYCFVLINMHAKTHEHIIALYGIGACVRLSWLQFEWIQMAIHQEMVKTFEWAAHDISATGFVFIVSVYILSNIRSRVPDYGN